MRTVPARRQINGTLLASYPLIDPRPAIFQGVSRGQGAIVAVSDDRARGFGGFLTRAS